MDITTPFQTPLLNSTELARILPHLAEDGGCWIWTGNTNGKGYGQVYVLSRVWTTHRLSYTLTKGAPEPRQHVDHLCKNRRCYRPDHLEAVSPRINVVERGEGITAQNARKTHCPRCGGEYDYITPDGKRACKTCRSANRKAYRRRLHEAGLPVK